jgi:membrane-bound lytic murein transglycosylase D
VSDAVRLYLEAGLILSVSAVTLGSWWTLKGRRFGSGAAATWLWASRAALVVAVVAPCALRLVPAPAFTVEVALPWTPPPLDSPAVQRITSGHVGAGGPRQRSIPSSSGRDVLAAWMAWVAVSMVSSLRARRRLRHDVERLPVIHHRGRVTVSASDVAPSPYSLVWGRRAWIVVPTELVARPRTLGLAVAHEAAHVRGHDAVWDTVVQVVCAAFAWNPAVHWWRRLHAELQEAACDAAVLARHGRSVGAYAEMLVWAAGQWAEQRFVPRGALGVGPTALHRRIAMVTRVTTDGRRHARIAALISMLVAAGVGGLARAQEPAARVSKEQAEEMAARRPVPTLVVRVDDAVLAELNALIDSPGDRARLKAALDRMAPDGDAVQAVLREKGLPIELKAVPLIESGYRNLPQAPRADSSPRAPRGAGLWMLIPETARRLGLEVTSGRDDRLDVARETAAAVAYLEALHARFGDWSLALAAYNQGEGTVQRAIASGRTRDAAALAQSGHLNRYHATAMAAVLVMENPRLLE